MNAQELGHLVMILALGSGWFLEWRWRRADRVQRVSDDWLTGYRCGLGMCDDDEGDE